MLTLTFFLRTIDRTSLAVHATTNTINTNTIDTNTASSVELNRLIIGIEPNKSQNEVRSLTTGLGLTLIKYWPEIDAALVGIEPDLPENLSIEASSQNAEQAFALLQTTRKRLEQLPDFRYVSYNERIRAVSQPRSIQPLSIQPRSIQSLFSQSTGTPPPAVEPIPNDSEFFEQWGSPMIQVARSWNIGQGNPDVVIAVIDSGFNQEHPDLDVSRLWTNEAEVAGTPGVDDDNNGFIDDTSGWDWVNRDNDLSNDGYGHGTHVGGTIAATINNNLGIAGLGRNITILPLRILNDGGGGNVASLVDALIYAKNAKARIANLSLVLERDSIAVSEAIDLVSDDMMIVSATGNDSTYVYWPAAYSSTIAVAATNIQDEYAPLSNRGPEVDLAAPGVDILSTGTSSNYIENTGTSMATPHVSSLAGLIASLRPDFSNAKILDVMKNSAVDINEEEYPGVDEFIGYGRIDFYKALLSASNGLQWRPTSSTDSYTFSRFPVEYNVQVRTPSTAAKSSISVHGAVVHYKLLLGTETVAADSIDIRGYSVTDSNGVASIAFWAPLKTGKYTLQTQVGQQIVDFPLTVYEPPTKVELSVDSKTIQAGNGTTTVSLTMRDRNNNLISGPLPFRLVTDSGSFGNDQQSIKLVANDGLHSTTFYAGTEATDARIRARFADRELDVTTIEITPSVAKKVDVFLDRPVIRTDLGETSAIMTLVTKDIYGNKLKGELSFNIYTSMGDVTSTLIQSVNRDEVSTEFTVSPDDLGEAKIWVSLPSSQIVTDVIVTVSDRPIASGTTIIPDPIETVSSIDGSIVRTKALLPIITNSLLCTTLKMEAENGLFSGDFVAAEDNRASGGAFAHIPRGAPVGTINTESRAVYQFDVPNAGLYRIAVSVSATDSGSNSFFFTVNGAPEVGDVYNISNISETYIDDYVSSRYVRKPLEVDLAAGQNQVTFYLRESGARLDTVAFEEVCQTE